MNTKIILAVAAVAALALAAVGLAAAQLAQNQIVPAGQDSTVPAEGFWGWIGSCFGLRGAQAGYYGEPAAPQAPSEGTPYQGGYGYGYGPCWAAWR